MDTTQIVTMAFVVLLVGYFYALGRRVALTQGVARPERPWSEAWMLEALRDIGRGVAATAAMGRPLPGEEPPVVPPSKQVRARCGQA